MPGALGWGDPRVIKEKLEQAGVTCWLDIEQAGKVRTSEGDMLAGHRTSWKGKNKRG